MTCAWRRVRSPLRMGDGDGDGRLPLCCAHHRTVHRPLATVAASRPFSATVAALQPSRPCSHRGLAAGACTTAASSSQPCIVHPRTLAPSRWGMDRRQGADSGRLRLPSLTSLPRAHCRRWAPRQTARHPPSVVSGPAKGWKSQRRSNMGGGTSLGAPAIVLDTRLSVRPKLKTEWVYGCMIQDQPKQGVHAASSLRRRRGRTKTQGTTTASLAPGGARSLDNCWSCRRCCFLGGRMKRVSSETFTQQRHFPRSFFSGPGFAGVVDLGCAGVFDHPGPFSALLS